MTGDASQLAEQQEAFARLSPHIRDLALYTSDSRELGLERSVPGVEITSTSIEHSTKLDNLSVPVMEDMELPGFGIRS